MKVAAVSGCKVAGGFREAMGEVEAGGIMADDIGIIPMC
jgi:hypothetical protein